jgi:hypothetical protein
VELKELLLLNLKMQGSIPECIGNLKLLWYLELSENEFSGELPIGICDLLDLEELLIYNTHIKGSILFFKLKGSIPECIGQLTFLQTLYLNDRRNSNTFIGPLPSSMRNLVRLKKLYLNIATLNGSLPDLRRLTQLDDCAFTPSEMCVIPELVPVDSNCDFSVLPECESNSDCVIIADWQPKMFDAYTCCQVDGVTCEEENIVILDLSSKKTGSKIINEIPVSIGKLDELKELYLQDNILEGNLPLSISDISSLQIVNISNNFLSGVIPFDPTFELVGLVSNQDLSLQDSTLTVLTEESKDPRETTYSESSSASDTIVGITGAVVFLVTSISIATGVYLYLRRAKRHREDTSYTPSDDWSDEIPMSSVSGSGMYFTDDEIPKNANGLVFKCLISTGGFGQVWKVFFKSF